MRNGFIVTTLAGLLLSGCDAKIRAGDKGDADVSINTMGGHVSLDTKDLQADLKLPKVAMDAAHMDIDGVQLYPGTKVKGVNVQAHDAADGADQGKVTIAFANPDAPTKLLDYYHKALSDRGYSVAAATAGTLALAAAKPPHKDVRVALEPEGSGSTGTIVVSGE